MKNGKFPEHFEPEEIKAQNKHLVSRDNKANLHLNIQPTQRQAEYFSTYRNIADDVSHAEFHPMQDSHSSVAQFDRYPMRSYSMNVTSAEPAPRVILQQIAAQPEPEELLVVLKFCKREPVRNSFYLYCSPMDWTVASNAAYCSDELDEPSGIDLTDFVSLHDMMAVRQKLDADLGLIPPKYMGTRSRGIPQLSLENESLCTTNYSSVKRRGLKGVWRQFRDTFRRR